MGKSEKTRISAHVLLVEDHEDTAWPLAMLLELDGYQVSVAGGLEDAVCLCEAAKPDVLLVDVELPDGDGLDLLARVRQACRAPAIVFSGHVTPDLRERARHVGFRDYLVKPVTTEVLTAAIRRAIDVSRSSASA
jgi:DNA-binding response OmpR family regulator